AVTQGFGHVGNLNAALGEAVYMMGLENNSDIVKMASYAPIFANINETRWRPDMIQFNATRAMGTPSYYVQRIMADNVGTRIMTVKQDNPYTTNPDNVKMKPATCTVGVGTWGTQASFEEKALTLLPNTSTKPIDKTEVRGQWNKDGNVVKQTSWEEGSVKLNSQLFTSDEYTYKVRARKDKGNEGFLIVFNYVDEDNYCWLNLGGWGNSQHAIEQVTDGSKTQIAAAQGHVEEGRWYDVEIHVKGDSIYTSIDGKQIFATKMKPSTFAGFFSSATYNEPTGEYIVKLVNTSSEATTARINLKNHKSSVGRVVRLTGDKGTAENTIDELTRVVPTEEQVSPDADGVTLDIPANSLNIVRIK
ncbi:MAG TPA: arabinosidase, partial [Prevotella sp.]|nr:arabinosidase [Prevotella sp.]